MTALRLADLPEGEPDALAHDLDAGCAWCGAVTRDLEPDETDPSELACAACRALPADPVVRIAGVIVPALELGRPEASTTARARATADLIVAGGSASALALRVESREMDRAVARMVRRLAADALSALAEGLRRLPIAPSGAEVDLLARAAVVAEQRLDAAVVWEQQRAEARSVLHTRRTRS